MVIQQPNDDDQQGDPVPPIKQGGPVPHIVGVHRRGELFYLIEGAEGGRVHRIDSRGEFAELLFTPNGRMRLLAALAPPFAHACFPENIDGVIENVFCVPKVYFEPVFRGNDNRTIEQIRNEMPPAFSVRSLGAPMGDAPFVVSYIPSSSLDINHLT